MKSFLSVSPFFHFSPHVAFLLTAPFVHFAPILLFWLFLLQCSCHHVLRYHMDNESRVLLSLSPPPKDSISATLSPTSWLKTETPKRCLKMNYAAIIASPDIPKLRLLPATTISDFTMNEYLRRAHQLRREEKATPALLVSVIAKRLEDGMQVCSLSHFDDDF